MLEKTTNNENKYIILYADEFKSDIWANYMEILNLPHNTQEVKLEINQVIIDSHE